MSKRFKAITSRKPQRLHEQRVPRLTHEQKTVVECQSPCVLVQAGAGTGKTTMLRAYAEMRPQQRFVYISFNKAIQEKAEREFPPNVKCVTFDALAYRRYVYGYKVDVDVSGGMRPLNAAFVRTTLRDKTFRLRSGERLQVPYARCQQIAATLTLFSRSAVDAKDARVHRRHIPEEVRHALNNDVHAMNHIKQLAQYVWRFYLRRQSPHLCYDLNRLVLWAEGIERDIDRKTTLLVDEAQDLNASMAAALMSTPHQLVVVGDMYQQIYGSLMGTVNLLSCLHRQGTHLFQLTHSFRFSQQIATLLSRLLNLMDAHPRVRDVYHRRVRLRGAKARHTRIMHPNEAMETPFVALFRSNQKLFARAVTFAKKELRIHILGWRQMRLQLLAGKGNEGMSRILERYDDAVMHDAIRTIEAHHVDEEKDADVILSTIHKFKGREAKRVWVHNDIKLKTQFQFEERDGHEGVVWHPKDREEINLVYVACSRAIELLRIDVDLPQYVYEAENVTVGDRGGGREGGVVMPEDTSGSTAIRVKRLGEQPRTLYLLKPNKRRSG